MTIEWLSLREKMLAAGMLTEQDITGVQSPEIELNIVSVYNPRIWEKPDQEKVGKFIIREEWSMDKVVYPDNIPFIPLIISSSYSGNIAMRNEFWAPIKGADNKIMEKFIYSNEYFPLSKKETPLHINAMNKKSKEYIGSFPRFEFINLAKSRLINGKSNPLFKEGKNLLWDFYDSTHMDKKYVIYGLCTGWFYEGKIIKMRVSPSVVAKWDSVIQKELHQHVGTFKYAMDIALDNINEINRKEWQREMPNTSYLSNPAIAEIILSVWKHEWKDTYKPIFSFKKILTDDFSNAFKAIKKAKDIQDRLFHYQFWEIDKTKNIWFESLAMLEQPGSGSDLITQPAKQDFVDNSAKTATYTIEDVPF